MQSQDYLQNRVDDQITWMEKKSAENQARYKQIKVAEIVTAAAIPFLAGLQGDTNKNVAIVIGVLGVLLVILNGLQQLYKYHENWITYRTTAESLQREKILFQTATGPYAQADAFVVFVQNFEAIL
ncbi:MAG: DUF4231 domain-containing protein, partial [Bacteroidota bacterium]|nr:DUF4231 domain-containing protein [Bacteroidota bacterium]